MCGGLDAVWARFLLFFKQKKALECDETVERKRGTNLCTREHLGADEIVPSSDSPASRDNSASVCSSQTSEAEQRPQYAGSIEEAESSLRQTTYLYTEKALECDETVWNGSGERTRELLGVDEIVPSSDSPASRDNLASVCSSRTGEAEQRPPDAGNIEEAESSLCRTTYLYTEKALECDETVWNGSGECTREQLGVDEIVPSSDSPASRDNSASVCSCRTSEAEHRPPEAGSIEEAESSLRQTTYLKSEKTLECDETVWNGSGERTREQLGVDEIVPLSDSPASRDNLASVCSSQTSEAEQRPQDAGSIEEAESSLRRTTYLYTEKALECDETVWNGSGECTREQLGVDEIVPSSDSPASRDNSASVCSCRTSESEHRPPEAGSIEEAESSLRQTTYLKSEKALECDETVWNGSGERTREQLGVDEIVPSSDTPTSRDNLASVCSSQTSEAEQRPQDAGSIEEAESSLRQTTYLYTEKALECDETVSNGSRECIREQLGVDEIVPSSDCPASRDNSASVCSSRTGEAEQRPPDAGNIEEAESSLRQTTYLKSEAARALLGRLEYQKGNIKSALYVFEEIDIADVTPKMKLSIAQSVERYKHCSHSDDTPPMSMHSVSLLSEAILLKSKSLQILGRFRDAAQSCNVILDTFESALPEGLPKNFGTDVKLQETLNKAVELLPELWKLSGFAHEAILSYRRALLHQWNLDVETTARIEKEFSIFLLYGGCDARPPSLCYQIEGSFVPRNNIEEALLLLMILSKKISLTWIEWDPSILDHLSFALSMSGELRALANQFLELFPGILDRKERYYILALCHHGAGDDIVAQNLLRKLLDSRENPNSVPGLLLASKIFGENPCCAEEGVGFARRALDLLLQGGCDQMKSVAYCLLGVSLSAEARSVDLKSERNKKESEALKALETADRTMRERDPKLLFHLCLENAEQRKLYVALCYAKELLKLEADSNVRGWILLAQILSAQKYYKDAETVINTALDQTGKWDQGDLLRTKATLQIAQGQLSNAYKTYTRLLADLQIQRKSFGAGLKLQKDGGKHYRILEIEAWHDLASVYTHLKWWNDAVTALSNSKNISPYSASHCHATGLLYQAKGHHREALEEFSSALAIESTHVRSLVSKAIVLRQLGNESFAEVRGLLIDALRLDRSNSAAWYSLGLLYQAEGGASAQEAAECFQTAAHLEDTAPVEPFR